jgi:uracil-DNA glycosylase
LTSIGTLPADWRAAIGPALSDAALAELEAKVAARRASERVYPAAQDVFAALRLTPYESVRAVIIGQDPYHGPGEAHGLAFSVPAGVPIPPSLRNIRRELETDLGLAMPASGSLETWARHGVLLLNAILSVAEGRPGSHRDLGWQALTREVVRAVQRVDRPVAFLLWGGFARRMAEPIDSSRHVAVQTWHPSPFSAKRGFLGRRPFSTVNDLLRARGASEIDWRLTDVKG